MTDATDTTKAELRSRARARRDGIPAAVRGVKTAAVNTELKRRLDAAMAAGDAHPRVCVYAAMGSELNVDDFAAHAFARGCSVAFPFMYDDGSGVSMRMGFVERDAFERKDVPFIVDPLLTVHPDDDTARQVTVCEATDASFIVVPLLGFDAAGTRLGYGGGFYDRFLSAVMAASSRNDDDRVTPTVLGAAFDEQRFASLPSEAHDIAVRTIDA